MDICLSLSLNLFMSISAMGIISRAHILSSGALENQRRSIVSYNIQYY